MFKIFNRNITKEAVEVLIRRLIYLSIVFIVILVAFIAFSTNAHALSYKMCEDRVDINENCTMLTPTLTCTDYTYNVTTSEGTRLIEEGTLGLLTDSIYSFDVIWPEGYYIVSICDGSTREISVRHQCEIRKEFDWGMTWINIGMIFVCIVFIFLNMFR